MSGKINRHFVLLPEELAILRKKYDVDVFPYYPLNQAKTRQSQPQCFHYYAFFFGLFTIEKYNTC